VLLLAALPLRRLQLGGEVEEVAELLRSKVGDPEQMTAAEARRGGQGSFLLSRRLAALS
jgi:hypothetical protein